MNNQKRFPEEFKIEAVKQVTERGHRVAEVAEFDCRGRFHVLVFN